MHIYQPKSIPGDSLPEKAVQAEASHAELCLARPLHSSLGSVLNMADYNSDDLVSTKTKT